MKLVNGKWEYTGEESSKLNSRQFAREKAHKHSDQCAVSGCDLYERMPLWKIMGKTKEEWDEEHR